MLEARNAGKPIADARGEIGMVVEMLPLLRRRAPERLLGQTIPVAGGVDMTFREPLGVVGLIVPWNFPLVDRLLEDRAGARRRQHGRPQAGRADAADRASSSSGSRSRRGSPRACSTSSPARARSAAGAWSSIPTSPRSPSPARPRSGAGIAAGAAGTIKRVTLELGGKSANVVFADADLEAAAAAAPLAVFGNAGQDCCARSRILVERDVARRLHGGARADRRGRCASATRSTRRPQMGPLISAGAARDGRLLRRRRGAGRHPRRRHPRGPGFWFPPTVLAPVDQRRPGRPRGDLRAGRRGDPVRRRGGGGRAGQRHDLRALGLDLDAATAAARCGSPGRSRPA